MEVIEAVPGERLVWDRQATTPFEARNVTTLTFSAAGGSSTTITWTLTGAHDVMGQAVGPDTDMDAMVGADVEQGLVMLEHLTSGATLIAWAKADAEDRDATQDTGD